MKKSLFFISCEEAQHICDKNQYGDATWWEKFKLSLRLSWCHITRAYVKQNKKLTKTIKDGHVKCMNKTEREELKEVFNQELNK